MAETWKSFGATLKRGWALIIHSLNVFRNYPCFILPILFVWCIYAPAVLYLKYEYAWKLHDLQENLFVLFGFIFVFSFLILMSCATVLEMIHQIESGNPSMVRAVGRVVGRDMFKLLPLALIWAVIWFVLTVIDALLNSKNGNNDDNKMSAQNAAATLSGYRNASISSAAIEAMQKSVRMVMFLIMPAIAWEGLGPADAVKKGLAVFRAHLGDYASGYALTYAAATLIFVPVAIIFQLGTGQHGNPPTVNFPDYVWVGVIIYTGIGWSFCVYLEQMFMAQLYLWHMKWEEKILKAKKNNQRLPEFDPVERPELLEKTPGLFA